MSLNECLPRGGAQCQCTPSSQRLARSMSATRIVEDANFSSLQPRLSPRGHGFRRTKLVLAAGAYIATFMWAYDQLTFAYADLGFAWRSRPVGAVGFVLLVALLPAVWPPRVSRTTIPLFWLLYVMLYVPGVLVPIFVLDNSTASVLTWTGTFAAGFLILRLTYELPLPVVRRHPLPHEVFWSFVVVLTVCCYGLVVRAYGLQFRLPSIAGVYQTRAQYRLETAANGTLGAYALEWLGYVLNPLFICYGFVRRRSLLLAAGVSGQLLIFATTGFKSVLFSPILLGLVICVRRLSPMLAGAAIQFATAGLAVISTAWYAAFGFIWLLALFVERLVAVPGLLTAYYFQFFSTNPRSHMAFGLLSGFLHSPYPVPPPFLIGRVYFGNPSTSANANIFASGYADFGMWGLFVTAIVLASLFLLIDSISRDNRLFVACLVANMAIELSNDALSTSLLTGGFGLLLLLLWFMPSTTRDTDLGGVVDRRNLVGAEGKERWRMSKPRWRVYGQ